MRHAAVITTHVSLSTLSSRESVTSAGPEIVPVICIIIDRYYDMISETSSLIISDHPSAASVSYSEGQISLSHGTVCK